MIDFAQNGAQRDGHRIHVVAMVGLTLIILAAFLVIQPTVQAQSSAFCRDWSGDFGSQWTIDIGSTGGVYSYPFYRSGDFASIARAHYEPNMGKLTSMWMYIFSAVPSNNEPVRIAYTLSKNNSVVYDNTFYLYPYPSDTYWSANPRIALPDVDADYIVVEILQASDQEGAGGAIWYYQVNRLCGQQIVDTPTPTNTTGQTNTPERSPTPGPSATAYPSRTATITRTATRTRTPVPTFTRTSTFTATASNTPTSTSTGTITPITPTDTLSPTPWVYIPPTLEPTDAPMQSTLAEYTYSSPQPPSGECTDVGDPCYLWPDMNFPDINLDTPTALAMLPTLTPLATTTPIEFDPSGTPVLVFAQEVNRLITAVSAANGVNTTMNLVDAQGTPVEVAQKFYEAGGQIGGVVSVVRGILPADIGPAGGLLLFILAMLLLNVQIRLILFLLPIILKIIEFFVNIFGVLIKLLLLIALTSALFILPARALAQTPTPTPTVTPLPTWTPTPTLVTPAPTATSKYKGLRNTPTPYSITPYSGLVIDMDEPAGQVADQVINMYRALNSTQILDMFSFVGLLIVCIILLVQALRRLTTPAE